MAEDTINIARDTVVNIRSSVLQTRGRLGKLAPLHRQHLIRLSGVQSLKHCPHGWGLPLLMQVAGHVLQVVLSAVVTLHLTSYRSLDCCGHVCFLLPVLI